KVPVLLSNQAPGQLEDITEATGLRQPRSCASGVAGDFDNDMAQDIYLVCRGGAQHLPDLLLENDGNGNFIEVDSGASGITGLAVTDGAGTGDSVVSLDYNLDGRLDLMVSNGLNLYPIARPDIIEGGVGGPYQLFENQTSGGNW